MGSLMAGWDSPFHDPKTVKLERNKSLTKEGIEAYWRSQKRDENEHVVVTKSTDQEPKKKKYRRSNSVPLTNTRGVLMELDAEINFEKLIKEKGWWTRSNSAHLNEPPVITSEGPTYKYTSQFHVAGIASSNSHPRKGINA